MTQPVRLRLARTARFNLQDHSRAVNGLPARSVARPTKHGNPYEVVPSGHGGTKRWAVKKGGRIVATPLTFADAVDMAIAGFVREVLPTLDLTPLRGSNLACWCKLGQKCHADVLLEHANKEEPHGEG